MKKRVFTIAALLTFVAVFASVPAALADDDDDGTPPVAAAISWSSSSQDEASIDFGATWQPALEVPPHELYSTIPGTTWISYAADKGVSDLPPPWHIRYRHFFDVPDATIDGMTVSCQATSLSVILHVDNDASSTALPPGSSGGVFLNNALFGSTAPGELFTTFQNPPEGPYTTAGPFLETGNVLEFRTNDYGRPTALNYEATLNVLCGGGGDDDDDDDDDDGDDDDGDDDD